MMAGCNIAVLLLLLLLLLSPEQGDALPAPTPAPLIHIAPGVELPQVVLGTGSGQKGNVSAATALWLSTAGVGIDTAYEYHDESEVAVGIAASGKPRGSVFLETKIPCTTYSIAKKNIAQNLVDLQMKTVDLTLIHTTSSWGPGKCDLSGTWRALEEALAAGHSRSIGAYTCCSLRASLPLHLNSALGPRCFALQARQFRAAEGCRSHGGTSTESGRTFSRVPRRCDDQVLQRARHRLSILFSPLRRRQRELVYAVGG
jgi:hypothetical protein